MANAHPGTSKTSGAIERILEMIANEALEPGQRLPSERALAADLKVSRATVREAIMALQIAGRVESRSGDGTYILEAPAQIGDAALKVQTGVDIADALEYRMATEISAAVLSCARARRSDVMRMQAVVEAMSECLEDDDYEGYLDATYDLHLAIGQASHSKRLGTIHRALTEQTRDEEWLLAESYTSEVAAHSMQLHREMVSAIAARDVGRTAHAVQAHYVEFPALVEG
ncbi:MAG: FadR/GntR family transcriptional regulator [Ancrocorticia sp.]|uniref:FadR/GntR family transcriptional regulator n=1 Tax=Ancrocorticia sp. TaxID=2593684 RepID=UPI003F91D7C1